MTMTQTSIRKSYVQVMFAPLARLFSTVLEEDVTPRQSAYLLNAIVALLLTVFSLAVPFVFRLLCLAWLVLALRSCKFALGKDE